MNSQYTFIANSQYVLRVPCQHRKKFEKIKTKKLLRFKVLLVLCVRSHALSDDKHARYRTPLGLE